MISAADAFRLVVAYLRRIFTEQLRSVALVVVYLLFFQLVVLGAPISDPLALGAAIALVVVGLALFMEGLRLGVMPLAETIGLRLPQRANGAAWAIGFAFVLGALATAAEPAVAALRLAGATVRAWEAPLLYALLNRHSPWLLAAIAAGVGLAMCLGMVRFFVRMPLRAILLVTVLLLLAMSGWYATHAQLRQVLALAWDSGAITTGPVTVPIIVALSVGVSRILGKEETTGSSLGAVALASLFPIVAVMVLSLVISSSVPRPMDERRFFATAQRSAAIELFDSTEQLIEHGLQRAQDPEVRAALAAERAALQLPDRNGDTATSGAAEAGAGAAAGYLRSAARAVLPLAAVLLIVLLVVLRARLPRADEVMLGLVLTLVGMATLTAGIDRGLAQLGSQVGTALPVGAGSQRGQPMVHGLQLAQLHTAVTPTGETRRFFYLQDRGRLRTVPFDPHRYDPSTATYRLASPRTTLFGWERGLGGIVLVLLFGLVMGFGASLAEPALNTLGRTVEDITVGTLRSARLVRTVGVGVGAGIAVGVAQIIYGVPIIWVLAPIYLVLLGLNALADDNFVSLAWDSAGVTTGPVTVPLVLSLGLGLSSSAGATAGTGGFGILAAASAMPILSVLLLGLRVRSVQSAALETPR